MASSPMKLSNAFSNYIEHHHINQVSTEIPRLELDSHADSPVVGHNAHIMFETENTLMSVDSPIH